MAKKKPADTKKIQNRRARFDYALGTEYIAGISLTGKETKSLRLGHGHIRGAYVTLKDGEAWLINATITGYTGAKIEESDQTRARKLLLKNKEIEELEAAKQQGKTIVPLDVLTGGRYIKIRISTGRGKKKYDKRETIKKREETRQIRRTIKQAS